LIPLMTNNDAAAFRFQLRYDADDMINHRAAAQGVEQFRCFRFNAFALTGGKNRNVALHTL